MLREKQFKIEKATPENGYEIAKLMHLAFEEFSFYMFGNISIEEVYQTYEMLWKQSNNRMSHEYSYIVKDNEKPISVMTSYEGLNISKLFFPSLIQIIKNNPKWLLHGISHLKNVRKILNTSEAEMDEYFIFILAVDQKYQNNGIGTQFLEFAEVLARTRNFKKISLLVKTTNIDGIRFYERNGYVKVRELKYDGDNLNYFKVIKTLG